MKHLIKRIGPYLPQILRRPLTLSQLDLTSVVEGVTFKMADQPEEFEQAFTVLHDSYLRAGFTGDNPEHIRIIPQFFLPSTAVLIAKYRDQVIGTMSLIRDNPLGLPLESIFDVGELRAEGLRLTEISSLAIHPQHRNKSGALLHQFIRYMWNFALEAHGTERFVIAVNPSMVQLYEDVYHFRKIPQKSLIDNYEFVKGAPAVALYIDALRSRDIFAKAYSGASPQRHGGYEFI